MNYIIVIGLFQALITALLFFISGKNKPLDWLLLTLLTFVFAHMAIKFSIYVLMNNMVLRQSFNTFIVLGYGPVLWMIARKAENDRYLLSKDWISLIPTAIAGFFYLGIVAFMSVTGTVPVQVIDLYNHITSVVIIISCFAYALMTLKVSRNFNQFWLTEQRMIRSLSFIFLSMSLTMIFGSFLNFQKNQFLAASIAMRVLVYSHLLIICIVILRYRVLAQTELNIHVPDHLPALHTLSPAFDLQANAMPLQAVFAREAGPFDNGSTSIATYTGLTPAPVIAKNGLSGAQQLLIVQKLSETMQSKKPFLDPDLDLKKLSALSGISKHHISEALNQSAQKTFYQFVNEHRIEEVLLLLDKCKQNAVKPNILSLAFDVGFNSKSTFNLYFKKSTGFTPSGYLKK
jgi:AraC-like DNA-binding protein